MRSLFLLPLLLLALAGCDQVNSTLGLEDPVKKEARQEAEGRAVGSACRQSGRAIEDCYAIYTWLPKAAIYAGWRDMDAYMRENDIDTVVPQLPPSDPPGTRKRKKPVEPEESSSDEKIGKKSADKAEAPADKALKTENPAEKAGTKH